MVEPRGPRRFPCTPGGSIARGRRRLRRLLFGLLAALLVAAAAAAATGAWGGTAIALVVALAPWTAWRMSGDLDCLWLELQGDRLTVRMRRRREIVPIPEARARRLAADEIAHLERLATIGGVAASSGGFESARLGGELELHASDFARAVLVESGETRLIVTPDDPEAFVAAVRAAAPS